MERCWGVDVSTRRVAFATDAGQSWSLAVGGDSTGAERLDRAHHHVGEFARYLAAEVPPLCVWVERPMVRGGLRVHVSLTDMVGIVQQALYGTLKEMFPHPVSVFTLNPPQWKAPSVGHGNASKEQVGDWCRTMGWEPANEDEADALGVAVAGAGMVRLHQVG